MRPARSRRLALLLASLVVAGLPGATQAAAGDAGALKVGRGLLSRDCGACHAVGPRGASPRPGAPAFRDLSRRYDVDALGEALAEGLVTGHPDMPEFRFTPQEVDAILRYLRRIQATRSRDAGQ